MKKLVSLLIALAMLVTTSLAVLADAPREAVAEAAKYVPSDAQLTSTGEDANTLEMTFKDSKDNQYRVYLSKSPLLVMRVNMKSADEAGGKQIGLEESAVRALVAQAFPGSLVSSVFVEAKGKEELYFVALFEREGQFYKARFNAANGRMTHYVMRGMPQMEQMPGVVIKTAQAMQLALDDPGRVRSLVIVNSAPEFIRRSLFTLLEGMRRTVIVHWRGLRALGERISRRLLPDPAQEALRAAFVERFAQNDPSAYLNSLKALVGWSVTARLPAIRCPTLIVASEHDYTPVGMQEKYARRIPGARFVTIPGAHHAVPVERPNTFNAVLADFWTMLDAPPEMPPPAPPGA